jgi:hypothetical protein
MHERRTSQYLVPGKWMDSSGRLEGPSSSSASVDTLTARPTAVTRHVRRRVLDGHRDAARGQQRGANVVHRRVAWCEPCAVFMTVSPPNLPTLLTDLFCKGKAAFPCFELATAFLIRD